MRQPGATPWAFLLRPFRPGATLAFRALQLTGMGFPAIIGRHAGWAASVQRWFGGGSSSNRHVSISPGAEAMSGFSDRKRHLRLTRRLLCEPLEQRCLLSVTPWAPTDLAFDPAEPLAAEIATFAVPEQEPGISELLALDDSNPAPDGEPSEEPSEQIWEPFVPALWQTESSYTWPDELAQLSATVRMTLKFPDSSYRITDWGQIQRQGNTFIVDARPEHTQGGGGGWEENCESHGYELGILAPGEYTFEFRAWGETVRSRDLEVLTWEPLVPVEWITDITVAAPREGAGQSTSARVMLTF